LAAGEGLKGVVAAEAGQLPAGTVAFLFTDLEGSTALLEAHPAAYRDAVARHHALRHGWTDAHGSGRWAPRGRRTGAGGWATRPSG
jgi:class 3 adenylate cyclase